MATYGNKYLAGWGSRDNQQGYLYIDQLNYVSSILYGFQYNVPALQNPKGIAGQNWSVPTDADFSELATALGGASIAGNLLKEAGLTHWSATTVDVTNSSKFTGLSTGLRTSAGAFAGLGNNTYYWSSTFAGGGDFMWTWSLGLSSTFYRSQTSGKYGLSVRLVKGFTTLAEGGQGTYTGNNGVVYKTICIGGVEWMAENLMETEYADHTLIPNVTDNIAWTTLTTGARCSYNNVDANAGVVTTRTQLKMKDNLSINYAFGDWNNPIIPMQCEFEIQNDKDDFYELLPLMISEEKEYKVRLVVYYPTQYTLFEGFLNCDTVSQKYLHKQAIKFVASSFLNKLEGFHPISVDTLQNMVFINIIDEILRSTGADFSIRVNCKLHAEGDTLLVGQTLFNKNGFYTEVFWEDEVTRSSSLEILKAILISFDCYIYWWRGYWYIERYEDIWNTDNSYVEYVPAHLPASPITTHANTLSNFPIAVNHHTLKYTGQSQTLNVIPGLKTITVNLQDKRVFNLVLSDLKLAMPTLDPVPQPPYRSFLLWNGLGFLWDQIGETKSNIVSAVRRSRNLFMEVEIYHGLFSTFKVTVDAEDVQLNIKFKYITDLTKIAGWTKKWADYTFDFNYTLRIADSNNYLINSGEDWMTESGDSGGVVTKQVQMINIGGSSFDPLTKSVEVSISVPLGKVKTFLDGLDNGPLRGDVTLVVGIGIEKIHTPTDSDTIGSPISECWIGDINVTTSGGVQNNVIKGDVNASGFLNTKEIPMTLYDMESYNYKNGVLRGDSLNIRTERWGVLGGVYNTLAKGVCWSTSHNPTLADSHTNNGIGTEPFTSLITGLTPGTTYYIRAYYTTEPNTTLYGNEQTITTQVLTIGTHHQGGIIFYWLKPGDAGYDPLVRRGLIASIADQTTGNMWATLVGYAMDKEASVTNAIGQRIGTGKSNTDLMNDNLKTTSFIVADVLDYEHDGYDDWYMPSIRELNELFLMKDTIGGFAPSWYWSSSECSQSSDQGATPPDMPPITPGGKRAFCIDFGQNINVDWPYQFYDKNNNMRVRAIRSFDET